MSLNLWKQVPLKKLITTSIQNGYSPVCPEVGNGRWILGLGALGENGIDPKHIKPAPIEDEKVNDYLLSYGDFLVSRSNTLDKVGRAALFRGEIEQCAYPDLMMRFRIDEGQVYLNYLDAYLRCSSARKYFMKCAAGTSNSMVKINKKSLEKLPIVLPPYQEQKRIVEVLEAWNSAIALTEQLISAKQRLKKVIYQSIIPNNHRIDVPGWQWKKLGSIAHINKKTLQESTLPEFEFKYVDLASVKQGIIELPRVNIRFSDAPSRARRLAKSGDVLMATVRPNLQGFAYIENLPSSNFVFSTGFAILESKEGVDSRFIYQCLYSTAIQRQINARVMGSNYPAVNASDLKSIWFPVPDDPQKQSLVVDSLEKIDSEVGLLNQYLERLRKQKQGLMQKLLSGEWRVPVEEVAA